MKKRAFDISVATISILATAPVMAVTLLATAASMKGNPFFKQKRSGLNGQEFSIVKFKTMRDFNNAADPTSDAERVTKLGRVLRKYGVDELPQLFQVLSGTMSIIGPRPHNSNARQNNEYKNHPEITTVKPGLFGIAVVERAKRNAPLTQAEQIIYDKKYALSPPSIRSDLRLLFTGAALVIKNGNGASISNTPITYSEINEDKDPISPPPPSHD